MRVIDVVIGALWAAFWVYWLVAAFRVKSERPQSRGFAGVGVRAIIILLVFLLVRTRVISASSSAETPLLQGLGLALFLLGLSLAVWARVYLRGNWGMPMSEKADPELVTTGPYRYVRHPIYSGLILAGIGTGLAVGVYWLIVAAIVGAYFVFSASVEDRTMARLFPSTYPAYRHSTKMMVPFLL